MDDLERLKYTELRNLAKSLGLKAKGKADKLIRDIKKHYEDGEISTLSKKTVSESVSSASGDDEIVFSFNPVPPMTDAEEENKQILDDEIVFVENPDEKEDDDDDDKENDDCNKSGELESVEEKFCEINEEDQNLTVEFEENQVMKSEAADNDEMKDDADNDEMKDDADNDEMKDDADNDEIKNDADNDEIKIADNDEIKDDDDIKIADNDEMKDDDDIKIADNDEIKDDDDIKIADNDEMKDDADNDEVKEQLNTTFEIDNVDEGNDAVTETEMETKEEKKADGVQDLLEVMRPEMTDEEMKAELMAAIEKKIQNKKVTIMSPNAASEFVSRIPTISTAQKSQATNDEKANLKGKDWQKIHEKLFSKLDPLDVYLEKKNKRMQMMNTPVKSAKRIAVESQKVVEKIKTRKETRSTTKSSAQKPTQSFIPKITSTKSMSLQFTTTTSTINSSVTKSPRALVALTNKNKTTRSAKKSPVKTAKKSPVKTMKKTPSKSLTESVKKALKHTPKMSPKMSPKRSPLVKKPFSPFNFGNKSLTRTPDSSKKPKFDLQASLAKPITWKKHTGKLRPMAYGEVGPQYFKKGLNTSIQTNRENRRADAAKSRANRRDNLLNSRRNIKL